MRADSRAPLVAADYSSALLQLNDALTYASLTPERVRAIAAWSQEAGEFLYEDEIATDQISRDGVAIPLDIHVDLEPFGQSDRKVGAEENVKPKTAGAAPAAASAAAFHRRRDASLRDSKRREALLKGKEGSRRRQRWENSHLLNNPWAQPPEPIDWEIQPTGPRHEVPYYLASLWDSHYAQLAPSKSKSKSKSAKNGEGDKFPIPKELRAKLKHARAARGMLKDIEGNIRSFIEDHHRDKSSVRDKRQAVRRRASTASSTSSSTLSLHAECDDVSDPTEEAVSEDSFGSADSDDFIIVRRDIKAGKGTTTLGPAAEKSNGPEQQQHVVAQRMIFDGSVKDQTASFARWIVHSLAAYYGLSTWSVTLGERREAYVGIPRLPAHAQAKAQAKTRTKKRTAASAPILPQPLWMTI
ncbi:hypothetical protein KEM56_001249 [Ascosphaera pollenicola]|nr:hypothetical protein KEM56_001249 [Ascosphaera pollenicola]